MEEKQHCKKSILALNSQFARQKWKLQDMNSQLQEKAWIADYKLALWGKNEMLDLNLQLQVKSLNFGGIKSQLWEKGMIMEYKLTIVRKKVRIVEYKLAITRNTIRIARYKCSILTFYLYILWFWLFSCICEFIYRNSDFIYA